MKKIFKILVVAIVMAVAASCGTSYKVSNNPYEADGLGVSVDRDIAYDKAYHSAVVKIAEKANVEVVMDSKREYASVENSRGRADEDLYYNENSNVRAKVNASDLVVEAKYKEWRRAWRCTVTVKVSPDNIY